VERVLCRERSQIHREREVLRHRDVQDIGSGGGVVRVGLVVELSDPMIRQEFSLAYHVGGFPVSCSAAGSN
jgi:hypothetical protein